jgi:hypothetical protein
MKIMQKREHKGIFYVAAVLITMMTAGLAGCSKTGSSTSTTGAATYVNVMHMAPYAPAIDIYLNGKISSTAGGIPPGTFSQQYGPLMPGTYDVQFKKANADSLLAEIPASDYDTMSFYTLILYNTMPTGGTVRAIKIVDDFSHVSAASSNYRFFNLSPDCASVDFYLTNSTPVMTGRTPIDNFINPALNAFMPVTGGPYNLQVKAAGTDSVIAYLNNVGLQTGSAYTIFLSGIKNGTNNTHQINVLLASY